MIIVQLKGGLGNQLFQYAAGLSLSMHHHVPLKVDITELSGASKNNDTKRDFDLQQLAMPPIVATVTEINEKTHQPFVEKYFQKLLPPYKRKIYKEASFSFDEHFFHAGKNIYLKGYRQSEQYFLPIANTIKQGFLFKEEVTAKVEPLAVELRQTNSVSVHVRRGDFANPLFAAHHGTLDSSYYQTSIHKMQSLIGNCNFYVFTDSPEWVKENLQFPEEAVFVSGNMSTNHFQDFYLISQCRHNIIANSTFSWWAAWLNNNPEKIVIAPQHWFTSKLYNAKDIYASGWLVL